MPLLTEGPGMTRIIRFLALAVLGAVGTVAIAGDTPTMPSDPITGEKFDLAHPKFVAERIGKVVKVSGRENNGGTLTLRIDQAIPRTTGGRRPPVMQQTHQEIELSLAKDVAVRVLKLPAVEDDKGKARQRTNEELRQLKGVSNLPGYTGEFNRVQTDAVVRVHLVQPKRPKEAKSSDPAPSPLVAMIVIVTEAPPKK
jgi:hypothetical protein